MSITKDFELLEWSTFHDRYLTGGVIRLLAHARALESMLKRLEFIPTQDANMTLQSCPICNAWGNKIHRPDCQLAKLLEGVE